jgi:D-3-phosphoglycerate dehydrogenase
MSHQFKALVSDSLAAEGVSLLEHSGLFVRVDVKTGLDAAALHAVLPDYDVLLIRSMTKVKAETLNHATRLRVIGRAGAGVDNVDVPACTAKKVLVMNTPGGNNNAVAELALGLMFAIARKLCDANASTKAGKWEKSKFMGAELQGRTLGVVGLGAIGAIVSRKAAALGMHVLASDPYATARRGRELGATLVDFDTLLAKSDVVSVHVPLADSTRHLFDAAAFAKMKKGVWFIDAARGDIAAEADLLAALQSGQVGYAALDVFAQEPTPADNPLLLHPNVIATPHIGASTREAQDNVGIQIAQQVIRYLRDGVIENAVNSIA